MSKISDQDYLRQDQYRDSSNLKARISLHQLYSTNPYPWHRWVYDQFELPSQIRVLELGCGPGNIWRENVDRLPTDLKLTLADLSIGMVTEAREIISPYMENNYLASDAGYIPTDSGCFDIVVANHMLYHLPDIRRGLSEITRVLKPGGRLFAATNGHRHLGEMYDLAKFFIPDWEPSWKSADRFKLENAKEILSPHFDKVEIRVYDSDLEVTDWSPLEAYIRSMIFLPQVVDEDIILSMKEHVNSMISKQGRFQITKSQGIVIGELSGFLAKSP